MKSHHLTQIDIIKGLAVIAVILLHSLPFDLKRDLVYQFHIAQAVPVFLVIFGLNHGLSLKRRLPRNITAIYPQGYFVKYFKRLGFPFILTFTLSLLIGYSVSIFTGIDRLRLNRFLLFGRLPLAGPGNYFISLILQLILFFPILYHFYRRYPQIIIALSFLASLSIELAINLFSLKNNNYLPALLILRYLPMVSLGMWLSDNYRPNAKRNRFIFPGAVISSLFLLQQSINKISNSPYQHIISTFYSSLLILLGLKYLPRVLRQLLPRLIAFLGQASYHIFLIQIIYFTFNQNIKKGFLAHILLCLSLGTLFYFLEQQLNPWQKQ